MLTDGVTIQISFYLSSISAYENIPREAAIFRLFVFIIWLRVHCLFPFRMQILEEHRAHVK